MAVALLTDADKFPLDDEDRSLLASAGISLRELAGHAPEEIVASARGADAMLVYYARLTAPVIRQLDDLRVIARCGAGFDNIDTVAARERKIELVYVPDYGIDDVADHALALLLACARKVALSDRAIRARKWPGYPDLAPMRRLRGQTLGLYGYGRIGRNLADKARCLGLRTLAFDPYASDATATREELFRGSDFISIHVPLTEATRHSIGRPELSLMKSGAILVNTARGGIVDTNALFDALTSHHLAGAGLDVFEESPLPPDHPIRSCETAVFTPHSAAYSEDALSELRKRAFTDVIRVLHGEPAQNPIPEPQSPDL